MKNFDHLFRIALLLVLAAGLIVIAWHLSWIHKQAPDYRYEALADRPGIFVLDRQQGVVYVGQSLGGEKSIAWHVSPLPKQ